MASRHRDSASRVQPINIFNSPVGDWRFVNRNWFQFCRHLIPRNRGRLSGRSDRALLIFLVNKTRFYPCYVAGDA